MLIAEKRYIEICLNRIEQTLGWGHRDEWSSQDFEDLSEKILQKTGISLSATTLKRIWGRVQYKSAPSTQTLDALAAFLDYDCWRDFRQNHLMEKNGGSHTGADRPSLTLPILSGLVLAGMLTIGWFWIKSSDLAPREINFDPEQISFTSSPVVQGIPNTVIFTYQVAGVTADSFAIQQSWDRRRRQRINPDSSTFTAVYYYPGYFRAKILANEQILKEHDVYVESGGWLALINRYPKPVYLPLDTSGEAADRLAVNGGYLKEFERNFPEQSATLDFYQVKDFGEIRSDNFTLTTTLKNPKPFANNVCRKLWVIIMGSEGRMVIPLSEKGCVGELRLTAGETVVDGKTHDLSAFGTDLTRWNDLAVSASDQKLVILLNEEEIYRMAIPSDFGKIIGIRYRFGGAGEVRKVKLTDRSGEVVYEDSFVNTEARGHRGI